MLHVPEQVHNITVPSETISNLDEFIEKHPNLQEEELQAIEMTNPFVAHVESRSKHQSVMLATAVVKIEHNNRYLYAKALID